MSRIPLAWLQLTGQKGRLMVAIAGIAFADLLMLMQVGFESALYDSNTRLHESLDTDLVLVSPQARNLGDMSTIPQRRLHQARSLPKVASVAPFYTKAINWQNPQTRKKAAIFLFGFDLEHPAFALPEVNQNLAALKQPDRLLFDQATRGTYGEVIAQVEAGESVTTEIASRTVHIEGLYSVGGSFAGDGSLMASERTFRRLVPFSRGTVSMGLIKLVPGADAEATAAALKTYLPDDVRVLTKAELVAFEASYWRTNTPIGFIFMVGTAMGFVVGIIIVYQILYSDIADHMAEYATL
ncbi:MAG: ABC transporter permease DevC, partial [Cyanobacteria bacterium P01_A01_bin.135]